MEGDQYYLDAGTAMLLLSMTNLSKLFPPDGEVSDSDAATPIFTNLQHQYQFVNGKKLLSALNVTSTNEDAPKRRFTSIIDIPQLATFLEEQSENSLVLMVAKDDINASLWPVLKLGPNLPKKSGSQGFRCLMERVHVLKYRAMILETFY